MELLLKNSIIGVIYMKCGYGQGFTCGHAREIWLKNQRFHHSPTVSDEGVIALSI
jgi:hypothetical protein